MPEKRLGFVGIGAARAGTTWLAQCLGEHPRICMSNPKELNFFCKKHIWPWGSPTYHDRGRSWVEARFSQRHPGQLLGEYSVSYLVDPDSPHLIKNYRSDIKIIVALRNPIHALYSFYIQAGKQYDIPRKFEDFLQIYPQVSSYYCYYLHIKRFLEHFSQESCHFIIFEDIQNHPEEVLLNLYTFLGVDKTFQPSSINTRINEKKAPRSVLLRNLVGKTRIYFRKNQQIENATALLRFFGANKILDWVAAKNLYSTAFPAMHEKTRIKLLETYADENIRLGELVGRDLSSWNNSPNE
jgi:hypothetical protein